MLAVSAELIVGGIVGFSTDIQTAADIDSSLNKLVE